MFFLFSKILAFLIYPFSWIFFLLLYALIGKSQRRKKNSLAAALILFYVFSNSFIYERAARMWEIPAMRYGDLKAYDAGIVLGGMLTYDFEYHRIQFEQGVDRLLQGVELYKTGAIKKILFTGGSGRVSLPYMKEGMFVRRYLLTLGIPENDIWIENESRNTWENALFAKALLEKKGCPGGRFLLITSGRHMRRSLACFKKAGIPVTPYSVDRDASSGNQYSPDYLFLPNVETLAAWQAMLHEWIGMIVYKIKGYA